ncbi:MAG: 30S ribosomal protein S16 [Lentisphaerae bacterium]|jgi:small subunit ribosomal protein S16|nr:30S ribosomal protein S16 [Lentisphaerota bacterium]MBT4819619.1 30S ribosomal protein S16 [Lentisphaerota bacterium]MBT5607279.1 30S ribosomal protein S16 [Lentisphaerota bacterium]MBT7058792.1 30S ribosomal protein S16 [Lentisphaerota bacterium]MBT7842398.1 30S ribosomal protein S16 [Lentisphaerota bacterium]
MAVRIRLRRTGKRNAPSHRIVVADGRSPRNGRFIETVGTYNPVQKAETVDLERVDYWISQGAQPSDTVWGIIKRVRAGVPLGGKEVPPAADDATPPEPVAEEEPEAPAEEPAEAPEEDAEETE